MTAYEILKAAKEASEQGKTVVATPAPAPKKTISQPASDLGRAIVRAEQEREAAIRSTMDNQMLSRGCLVVLNCPIPGNDKVDREVTKRVQAREGMGEDSGRWAKTKFPPSVHRALESVVAAARKWHYKNTLPWPIIGARLLPAANQPDYIRGMQDWQRRVKEAQEQFIAELPRMREWAKREHNGNYDASLYDEAKIRASFGWSLTPQPLPCSDHWVGTIRDLLGADANTVDAMVQQGMRDAESDLINRVTIPLQSMANALAKHAKGERTKLAEALIENLRGIGSLIPGLNINGNPVLAEVSQDILAATDGLTKDDLSEDEQKRKAVREQVDAILRKMKGAV